MESSADRTSPTHWNLPKQPHGTTIEKNDNCKTKSVNSTFLFGDAINSDFQIIMTGIFYIRCHFHGSKWPYDRLAFLKV